MLFPFLECKGFEDDWERRNIDTSTQESPVINGTEVSISCAGGHENLAGSNIVTCIEDATFHGLDDIWCFGE